MAAIAMRAEVGEPTAKAVFKTYDDRLARGLTGLINVLDPQAIVLGAALSRIERHY